MTTASVDYFLKIITKLLIRHTCTPQRLYWQPQNQRWQGNYGDETVYRNTYRVTEGHTVTRGRNIIRGFPIKLISIASTCENVKRYFRSFFMHTFSDTTSGALLFDTHAFTVRCSFPGCHHLGSLFACLGVNEL